MKGYYTPIQYCPDPARQETANVGVALVCMEQEFFGHKLDHRNERPRKAFSMKNSQLQRLQETTESLEKRMQIDDEELSTVEALGCFVETRANSLLLTPLRNMRVEDPLQDLERLFAEPVL